MEKVIASCEQKSNDSGMMYCNVRELHQLLMAEISASQGVAAAGQKNFLIDVSKSNIFQKSGSVWWGLIGNEARTNNNQAGDLVKHASFTQFVGYRAKPVLGFLPFLYHFLINYTWQKLYQAFSKIIILIFLFWNDVLDYFNNILFYKAQ